MGFVNFIEGAWDRGWEAGKGLVLGVGDVLGIAKDIYVYAASDEERGSLTDAVLTSLNTRPAAALGHLFGPDEGLGAIIGGVPEVIRHPLRENIIDPVFAFSEATRDYVADRPISTLFTVLSLANGGRAPGPDWSDPESVEAWLNSPDAAKGSRSNPGTIIWEALSNPDVTFNAEIWKEQWALSENRSAGQALSMYANGIDITDENQVDLWLGSPRGRFTSGIFDATTAIFVDPLILVGKAGALRRGSLVVSGSRANEIIDLSSGARRQVAFPTHSVLPTEGSFLRHVAGGFRISPQEAQAIGFHRIDNSVNFKNTSEVIESIVLPRTDDVSLGSMRFSAGEEVTENLGSFAYRSFEETGKIAEEILGQFPTMPKEAAYGLASVKTAEEINLLLKLYHGNHRVLDGIVKRFEETSPTTTQLIEDTFWQLGPLREEAARLRPRTEESWWLSAENSNELRDFAVRSGSMGSSPNRLAKLAADDATEKFAATTSELQARSLRASADVLDEIGFSAGFLANVYDFKSNTLYDAIGRTAYMDAFGRRQFTDFSQEPVMRDAPAFYSYKNGEIADRRGVDRYGNQSGQSKIADAVNNQAKSNQRFDGEAKNAYLNELTNMHAYSLGSSFVQQLFESPLGDRGSKNLGIFDRFVTQSMLRKATGGMPFSAVLNGKHRVYDYVKYVPQGTIRFSEPVHATTQWGRFMDLLSNEAEFARFSDNQGGLFSVAETAEYKAAFNAADENGRVRIYQAVMSSAVDNFVDRLLPKYPEFNRDSVRAQLTKELKEGFTEFDEVMATARAVDDFVTTVAINPNETAVFNATPQMLKNTGTLPRFDKLLKQLDRDANREGWTGALGKGRDMTGDFLNSVNRIWKALILGRPAYGFRVLSDELARAIVAQGALGVFSGLFSAARGYEMARMRNRILRIEKNADMDYFAAAMDNVRNSNQIAEVLGVSVENLGKLQPDTILKRLVEKGEANLFIREIDNSIANLLAEGEKARRLFVSAAQVGGGYLFGGPLGVAVAGGLGLAKRHRRGQVSAHFGRPVSPVVARMSDETLIRYFNNALESDLTALKQAAEAGEDLAVLERAEMLIKTQQDTMARLSNDPEFQSLTPQQIRALTLAEQAAVARHSLGIGHIPVRNAMFGSAMGVTDDMREINYNAVSAKRGITDFMGTATRSFLDDLEINASVEMGTFTGSLADLWDKHVVRILTGFGEQTGGRSKFTNVLWLSPRAGTDHARTLDLVADRLGVRSRASALENVEGARQFEVAKEQFVDTVVDWLDNTADGRSVLNEMPDFAPFAENWVSDLVTSYEKVVPNAEEFAGVRRRLARGDQINYEADINPIMERFAAGDNTAQKRGAEYAAEMRQGASELSTSFQTAINKVINGATERTFGFSVDQLTERMYSTFATRPVDELSRIPYFKREYDREVRRRAALLPEKNGKVEVSPQQIYKIEEAARTAALETTRLRLFDLAERSRLGEMFTLVSPFFDAWMEVVSRWAGLIVENPVQVARLLVHASRDHDFVFENSEGERFFVFRMGVSGEGEIPALNLPNFGDLPGADGFFKAMDDQTFSMNTKALNAILTGMPGTGPMVGIPLGALAQGEPSTQEALSFFFPYGAPSGIGDFVEMALPAWAKRLLNAASEDRQARVNTTITVLRNELTNYELINGAGSSQIMLGDPAKRRAFMEEVERKASYLSWVIAGASAVLPASISVTTPFLQHVDKMREFRNEDPETATERFLEEIGEEFFWFTRTMSRNNLGLPATQESHERYLEFEELIQTFPEFASIIVGTNGSQVAQFSQYVYDAQFGERLGPGETTTLRERQSPAEFVESGLVAQGWRQYRVVMDEIDTELERRGLVSLQDPSARDLVLVKNQAVNTLGAMYPDWAKAYRENTGNSAFNIAQLEKMVQSPLLDGRDDIEQVREFFAVRRGYIELLIERQANGGSFSLSARTNSQLSEAWEADKQIFRMNYLAASSIYDRYLQFDSLLCTNERQCSWPEDLVERMDQSLLDQLYVNSDG